DVLMRRLEVLAPHKTAVRSLTRSASRNPGLALALNSLGVRSQQWMLTAADIAASGPRGMLRAQGLALLFASVLRTWVDDEDPGHAPTMAALDRALARGQRWSGLLDDVLRLPACIGGRRRRRDRADEQSAAAWFYTGTRTVARSPPSGLSESMMSPPCERAISRAIASPSPVPPSS